MAQSFSAWIKINFPELTAAEVFRDILVNQKTYFRKMLLIHFSPVFLVKQIPQMHPQTDCLCHSLGCRAASSNTLPYPFLQWYLRHHLIQAAPTFFTVSGFIHALEIVPPQLHPITPTGTRSSF